MTNPSPAPYVAPIAYSERVELLPLVLTSNFMKDGVQKQLTSTALVKVVK